ncbi:MAG: signal peptidase I [Phycisphaerae bacterium]
MPAPQQVSAAPSANQPGRGKEPVITQIAGFVDLFVWLLVFKSFFLPLFQIPTGSMAETLCGAHAPHTCPNCGWEYNAGFHTEGGPDLVQCPNCRWREPVSKDGRPGALLKEKPGDRIVVHGWPYDFGGILAPKRWDVVVFKVPSDGDTNYIKRLIGLPGETVEIVDGDVFIDGKVARKPDYAQRSLWIPYYYHDNRPEKAGYLVTGGDYHPRWSETTAQSGWTGLDTRVATFDSRDGARGEAQFVTGPPGQLAPGVVTDVYGYNGANSVFVPPGNEKVIFASAIVRDVRVGGEITFDGGDGYVEFEIAKDYGRFIARLFADGRVTLEHENRDGEQREIWADTRVKRPIGPTQFAVGHADYRVTVWLNGRPLLSSRPEQYDADVQTAKKRAAMGQNGSPRIRMAAESVKARVAHLAIDRDIYYTNSLSQRGRPPNAGTGNPLKLSPLEYFVMGDNSPASLDARYWYPDMMGPHLRGPFRGHTYQAGTVPADQMIGRAFLVYWPGFSQLAGTGFPLLPDLGRIRWIY